MIARVIALMTLDDDDEGEREMQSLLLLPPFTF
jgi:hypothetical protein